MFGWLKVIGNPWALLPIVVGVPLIFLAGAWWDGDRREDDITRRVSGRFLDTMTINELAGMTREAQAWEEVRNTRAAMAALAANFDRILQGSEEERAKFRAQLQVSRAEQVRLRDEAAGIMERLDDARTMLDTEWRAGNLPDSITCGVLNTPGCPDLSGRSAGAADARGGAVPGGAAGQGGAGAVPAAPPAGSGDGQGDKR